MKEQAETEPPLEIQQAFLWSHIESEYLFAPQVHTNLQEIWVKSCDLWAVVATMEQNFRTTGSYGQQEIQDKLAAMKWLNDKLVHLSDVFGDELKMGQLL